LPPVLQTNGNPTGDQLKDLIAQRLYGIVQGYEDLNDHDVLRHDPMVGLAIGKLTGEATEPARLAGKSTLNRLEQAMHVEGDLSEERYVKCSVQPGAIEQLMVAVTLEIGDEPKRMFLDIDVTDDAVHGEQVDKSLRS
jgi:Transposase DDE domain group 1